MQAGELTEAARLAEDMLALADSMRARPEWSETGTVDQWRSWAHYLLGSICYERNELESAAEHWKMVEAMRYRVNPGAYHVGLIGLALVAQARGVAAEALAYAQAARDFALESRSPPLLAYAEALAVRLALAGAVHGDALRRSREIDTTVNLSNTIWPEQPRLAVLRALLADATPVSLHTALALAETCLRQAESARSTRQIIPVLALQSLAWRAVHRPANAFDAIERALALGEPEQFTRTFLDLDVPMAELLRDLERQRRSSAYLKRLLAVFAEEPQAAARRDLTAQYVRWHGITPLTQRELQLLLVMEQRLTVNEMAEQLVISPNTVKKHVSSIYTKLGVNNRRQAVAKARDVGLLPAA